MNPVPIFLKGLTFCIPSAIFWAFQSFGRGGDIGGIVAFVFGLASLLLGLPWNVVLMIAWGALAQALDHPIWLGDTKNEWFFLAGVVFMSTPGAFINGLIVGWLTAKRKSKLNV